MTTDRPRCTRYFDQQFDGRNDRCPQPAVAHLHDNDGKRVPGVAVCWYCAPRILNEYNILLGWHWTAQPIDQPDKTIYKENVHG